MRPRHLTRRYARICGMTRNADLGRIKQALRKALPELRESYGVEPLAVCSIVRGEAGPASDVVEAVRLPCRQFDDAG